MVRLNSSKNEALDRPLSVVHLVYSFNIGGLERVIANLINSSDDKKVHHVIITLVAENDFLSSLSKDISVYCLNKKPGNDFSSHMRLFNVLRKLRPDVLHSYNFGTIEYHITAFFAHVTTRIHAEHGRDGEYDAQTRRRRTWVRKAVMPFLNFFVVVSPDLHQWAKEDLRIKEPKLQLVLNGIDTEAFGGGCIPFTSKTITLITVGRLAPIKNQSLLISAFDHLIKSPSIANTVKLIIVGEGPLHNELAEQIKRQSLEDSVVLLGPRNDVQELLKQADIFVLSSDYEAMPMTVLEAMASGLPVICTDVGGVRNIVSDLQTGLLVPADNSVALASAMKRAIENQREMIAMACRAKEAVDQKYSANAMKQRYESLYGL